MLRYLVCVTILISSFTLTVDLLQEELRISNEQNQCIATYIAQGTERSDINRNIRNNTGTCYTLN